MIIRDIQTEGGGGTPANIIVVLNWLEGLKRLVATNVPSKLIAIPRATHGPTFELAAGAPRPTDGLDHHGEMIQ